jgi:hypothetical protein
MHSNYSAKHIYQSALDKYHHPRIRGCVPPEQAKAWLREIEECRYAIAQERATEKRILARYESALSETHG